ncbi:hypothetical protein [Bradyrhizobium sp. AZCC 2289]|uniref:hypothetical protein n=1 Tax=Bradyrhizobium sp. AZCC 2289 TaxID=3117026 RepID=UPI002FEF0724
MERLLRAAVNPSAGAVVFILGIIAFYAVGTWYVGIDMSARTRSDMILLPWLSVTGVAIGSVFFPHRSPTVFLDGRGRIVVYGFTLIFLAFCILVIASAPSLPVLEAWKGASPAEIAVSRENFLKAREGWAAILPYANGFLTGAILPYCMCIAILRRYRFRWLIVVLFFLYSIVFVEKAFFLRVFLPLMVVGVVSQSRRIRLTWLLAAAIGLLMANILISGFGSASGMGVGKFLLFRTLFVPISTVTDSLDYWWQAYKGVPFAGATNLVLSKLFDLPRVQFEREVFVFEWGPSETGTGSSNAAFFVEAYVNFGWFGVFIISVLLGALITYIGRSRDQALRCVLPLVLYGLFLGGAFGLLFGNGLIACLLLSSILDRPILPATASPSQISTSE